MIKVQKKNRITVNGINVYFTRRTILVTVTCVGQPFSSEYGSQHLPLPAKSSSVARWHILRPLFANVAYLKVRWP